MNKILSYASGACFVVCATLFLTTWTWWLFPLSLLFQVGIFAPELISTYKKGKAQDGQEN